MEVPELNLKECASVFVRDDFYESIQAPKFHDFCSSFEEDSGDIDAFFRKSGGAIKVTRQFEGACLEPNLVKVQKDIIFPKSADFEGCQSGSPALIPDDYSTVERASVCGSKKVRPAIPSTTLTKSQDKVPIKSKTLKKANIPCNAPIPSTASDRSSSDSSQQLSSAEYHHPSENEDPNPTCHALRKRATRVISKSKAPPAMSSSVYAASQCLFERKKTSETMVLDVQFLESISNDAVGIDSAMKEQVLIKASQYEVSDVKGRKRKSSGRNVDGMVSKALEAQQSFKGRVSKVSRKVFVSVDTESCSDSKEGSTRPASSQPKGNVRSSFSASSTLAPAVTKKSSASPKVRRNSDQSRRRKSSSSTSARARRQNVPKGPSTEGKERTPGNPSQEGVSTMSSQASCSNEVISSSGGKKRDAGHDGDGMLQLLRKVSSLSWTGEVGASDSTIQDQEIVAHIFTKASQEGRPSVNQADCNVENGDQVERRQNSQLHDEHDEPQFSKGEPRSVGELLSEQLQNLHIMQGRESVSEKCAEAHESRGRFDEAGCQLAGLQVCEPMAFGHDVHEKRCIKESNESKRKPEVKDELEKVGILLDNFKVLDECETNSSVSHVANVEQGKKKSGVSNECQAEDRPIDVLEDSQTQSCFEFSTLHGCKVISAGSKIDDADQAALLEQLQNLRLPRGDESHASRESNEEKISVQKVTATLLSCSYSASSETKNESLSSASTSDIGKERKINIIQTSISDSASFSKKDKQDRVIEGRNVRGAHHAKPCVLKQNKKRKSTDMLAHKSDLGLLNTTVAPNSDEQQTAKLPVQSSAVGSLQSPAPFTVKSAPLSAAGQQKKMKTTCPQPFRLRTQERGALKEVEFNKKVEQYLAAKEKAPFTPLACETMKVTKKPPQAPSKESKWPARPVQQSRSRAAAAACSAQQEEEEIKKMRKKMVPHSQKMPSFDRPFKPHRSTKCPTIPSSPNFQHKMKKTTATLAIHD